MADSITLCRQCLHTECQCAEGNKNEKDDSTAAVLVRTADDNSVLGVLPPWWEGLLKMVGGQH